MGALRVHLASSHAIAAGWFPANYVEEIDLESLAKDEKDDKDNPLGTLEKIVMNVACEPMVVIFRCVTCRSDARGAASVHQQAASGVPHD